MKIDATKIRKYKNDIVAFAEDLYYLRPGEPIKLWDYQKEILYKATERTQNGAFKHRISIISLPRQNGKSELSTIIGLHALFFGGWGTEILSLAIGGKDNAKIIFKKARRAIKYSPALYESIGDKNFLKEVITVPELESSWEIKPSELLSTVGRAYDLVLFDELGMERVQLNEGTELYDSISAGQAAKPNARIFITSTVGGEHGKLYDLIKLANTDKSIFVYLRHDNPSPLITKEYLKARQKELHPSVYKHWHENRFFTGEDSFISAELFDSCIDPLAKPVHLMPKDNFTICWVDIGIKRDASVAVSVFRDADNKIRIAEIKSWSPQLLKKEIKLEWIEEYLMEAKERLNIKEIWIDEYQAQSIIQRHGKRLNIYGVHLTADKLERIWSNFIAIMQNGELVLYDDRSDDIIQLRREALNLTIQPRGASFKVIDPGKIHQDRILSLAGACWKMVEKFERARFVFPYYDCYLGIRDQCPLIHPGNFFSISCKQCDHFWYAARLMAETEEIDFNNSEPNSLLDKLEKFCVKIGGFGYRFSMFNR